MLNFKIKPKLCQTNYGYITTDDGRFNLISDLEFEFYVYTYIK